MKSRSTPYSIRFVQFETRQLEALERVAARESARGVRVLTGTRMGARLRSLVSR